MVPKEDKYKKIQELLKGEPELVARVTGTLEAIGSTESLEQLREVRVELLGRKGLVNHIFSNIKEVGPGEKAQWGQVGNLLKVLAEDMLTSKENELQKSKRERDYSEGAVDITLPGRERSRGTKHILRQVISEVTDIFLGLGYQVVEGPEVEHYYYNFEALNTPSYHPSTSVHDTFYIKGAESDQERPGDILLRTETSPVQVRVMSTRKPPVYVISPGKVYRRDVVDATHFPIFQQIEGFAVDEGINMGHLKGTLEVFARKMFGEDREVRFRPHFFPFTEPSAEVDVSCILCEGKGCSLCKGSGWLEILGSGMIDPNVFENVGYDPEEFSGFAFGMGVERIAILKYGVDDIRRFYENDIRFLNQF